MQCQHIHNTKSLITKALFSSLHTHFKNRWEKTLKWFEMSSNCCGKKTVAYITNLSRLDLTSLKRLAVIYYFLVIWGKQSTIYNDQHYILTILTHIVQTFHLWILPTPILYLSSSMAPSLQNPLGSLVNAFYSPACW